MNILVVEDEKNLAKAIASILETSGYQPKVAIDGITGFEAARSGLYDAIVLDIMLPGMSGFDIVRELRNEGNAIPVMMLTARTSTTDKIEGLDSGADDYMTKPFEMGEFLARLRALLRRQGGNVIMDVATFEDLSLDLSTHDLSCGEKSTHLSNREFEVMRMLMEASDGIVSKQDLLTRVWDMDADASENSVEAYISFLRKKLKYLKSNTKIVTRRMVGYKLERSA